MKNHFLVSMLASGLSIGLMMSSAWARDCEPRQNSLCLGAKMAGENLAGASYSGSDLHNGDFSKADLSKANLKGVNLYNL